MGELMLIFILMGVISIFGMLFLWLTKSQKEKMICFWGMGIWGMVIAYVSASALPVNFTSQRVICWVIGAAGIAGILIKYLVKSKTAEVIAQLLVSLSVLAGLWKLFF